MLWPLLILAACAALLCFQHLWLRRRHRAEMERAAREFAEAASQREQAVRVESQARLQTLFNSMIEGVLLLDTEGRVQFVNDSLRQGFGLAGNICGQTIMEAFRWHELAALAARLPKEKNICDAELEIHRVTRRFLQVNASIVHSHAGAGPGRHSSGVVFRKRPLLPTKSLYRAKRRRRCIVGKSISLVCRISYGAVGE